MTVPEILNRNILINSNCIHQSGNYIFINVEVTPNSTKSGIKGYNQWRDRILINLRSPAHKGRANNELLKIFSTILSINQKRLNIVKGFYSELKTIKIEGLSLDDVLERLLEAMNEKPSTN
jgi:uncharacterized protein (TIGR00251 family)